MGGIVVVWLLSKENLEVSSARSLDPGPAAAVTSIIETRSFEFSRRIIELCERLWKGTPAARRLADQLFDCGTSIGANSAEAQGGQTKPNFLAKLAISRKESHEVIYWLRLAVASGLVRPEDVAWELDEAHQLRAMITGGDQERPVIPVAWPSALSPEPSALSRCEP